MIRIAAVGDLHFDPDAAGTVRPRLEHLGERADVFLVAGDLTRLGEPHEAKVLAQELEGLPVPVVAVLGNHDYHADREDQVREVVEQGGITVLDGESTVLDVDGTRVGIAGMKGFGGGFAGASATDFGEPEMKAFVRHTIEVAGKLERVLRDLDADVRVVLLHYSPVAETLRGEPPEIHAFLGSYYLAEAIDRAGADLVIHGHAHRGSERGATPGGVPVRNVALPVIQRAYAVYEVAGRRAGDPDAAVGA
ncbi:MAG TPA: metallophosphoesterase [Actinomycetota bacterium]|nr:metallophosphoesterase [Actinomycetota bacterium]